MIAFSGDALIAAVATVLVAALTTLGGGVVWQARKTRTQLDTGNGHSAGEGVSKIEKAVGRLERAFDRVEDRQLRIERQVDRIDVRGEESHDLMAHVIARLDDVESRMTDNEGGTAP